ncbi:acetyltransferase [Fodinibius sediminis]|uniref:Sugar O-acyltransferase, sialic acid O-acetyltransferase NeuD family n=1 Tax=Fodinibius sediminis TaxID=1214077 RepID=A0A521B2W4_9BACT|nr:acetyltransferase [Fodinibius sediminis]SMO41389.1 sugar O-acyltransferase, sialic acid O-acetyltransferase NeuD family [Fodinibius sediminis]
MKKKLYIIGAGSVGGHLALNISEYSKKFDVVGFLDDDPEKIGTQQFGLRVIGGVDKALDMKNAAVVIGIAFPKVKRELLMKLSSNSSLLYPTLIHERAWISQSVTIGKGCIVYPGTTINFRSEIQDFVVINVNCSLGHHTTVGRYSSFAPGVNTGGHTIIEEAVDMGIGVSTLQDIRIGRDSTVGGQSMVIHSVRPNATVAGVPAKIIG